MSFGYPYGFLLVEGQTLSDHSFEIKKTMPQSDK
jgi:hypothetical protein